jgi:hypothetical protein
MPGEPPTLPVILDGLARLHDHKTVGYGNAWRKRGELLSIFTNLARKYDRLVVALDEGVTSGDEALLDTAADLCVYAAKYLTWLAETHSDDFNRASSGALAERCSDAAGTAALREVFAHVDGIHEGVGIGPSWDRVKDAFEPLEAGLLAQVGVGDAVPLSWQEKASATWSLTAAAARLTLAISHERPQEWSSFEREIDAMDGNR